MYKTDHLVLNNQSVCQVYNTTPKPKTHYRRLIAEDKVGRL